MTHPSRERLLTLARRNGALLIRYRLGEAVIGRRERVTLLGASFYVHGRIDATVHHEAVVSKWHNSMRRAHIEMTSMRPTHETHDRLPKS